MGASSLQVFKRVILPEIQPALFIGSALAFSRSIGEYGSVIFIAGNLPFKTEIAPVVIMSRLEQYDYAGAISIALVLLGASFILLSLIDCKMKLNT